MAERLDALTEEWPLRPWIMAALCAVAGLLVHLLTDQAGQDAVSASRQAAATFVAVAALSLVVTIERLRWTWAVGFALAWALVIAFVGWFTAGYNRGGEIAEFPFLSGIFAVLLAAPLFQTVRDEGAWRFPYGRLHSHAWTDAVIGAASLFFTGITFLLMLLISGLFSLIGIDLLKDLLEEGWFGWMLAGFAFGAAFGLLRERDRLVATLQRLVMTVFSVLAPVLAAALPLFLLSVPFTGLGKLWDSWVSAAALLLTASGGAILLANAVIGDGRQDRSGSRLLHWSALLLVLVVLPLCMLAGVAMGIRIGEYGWTPQRIWGAIAVAVGVAYGLGGWWATWRGRGDFDGHMRPLQTRLAIVLCGLALFLALPIVDFGAISARSQVARLEAGKVTPDRFDWAAMAFDFGPDGRRRLREWARSAPTQWRGQAVAALQAKERWGLAQQTQTATEADAIAPRLRLLSPGLELTPDILQRVASRRMCPREAQCGLVRMDAQRLILLVTDGEDRRLTSHVIDLSRPVQVEVTTAPPAGTTGVDLDRARIEVRTVPRRQVHVDGEPVGEVFE
ncbi:MAG: DUF4153 domain-containing protein [Pseudomonadota bacterium]|nr:DUF4153 domain-containing protein [Pseudomonadota bacterium]